MFIKAGTADGDAHRVYCNGAQIPAAIEADTEKGYVIALDHGPKGAFDPKYGNHVRKHKGKVELVHIYTGVVTQ